MTDESTNPMGDQPAEPEVPSAPEPAVDAEAAAPASPETAGEAVPEPPAPPAPPMDAPAPPPPAPPAPQAPAPAPGYAPPPPPPPAPGYAAPPPPPQTGYAAPAAAPAGDKQKMVAGILAILLGSFGVHKFYLGYQKEGIIMLVAWLAGWLTFGLVSSVIGLIGIIEGVIYLTKSDQEFYATYVAGQKPWF